MKDNLKGKFKKIYISMMIIYLLMIGIALIMVFPRAMGYVSNLLDELFYYNEEQSLVFLLMLLAMGAICVYVLFRIVIRETKKRIGDEITKEEFASKGAMTSERKHLEREIAMLNQRLVDSDSRWERIYRLVISSQSKSDVTDSEAINFSDGILRRFNVDYKELKPSKTSVLVLTPFHPDYESTYSVIKQICDDVHLKAERSDEEYVDGDLLQHIVKMIVEARIIIANLDGRNANVFYELGIAHSLNKPTVLLSHVGSTAPADVRGNYLVVYNSEDVLRRKLKTILLSFVNKDS